MITSITLCLLVTSLDARTEIKASLLPSKSVINIIPELLGFTGTTASKTSFDTSHTGLLKGITSDQGTWTNVVTEHDTEVATVSDGPGPQPPYPRYPVQHAGLPLSLAAYPLALENSYHELKFNVSWRPSLGPPARDYSIEVRSITDTIDCRTPMCYEYNIPGDASWWEVPAYPNPVAETCAVRPGCAYSVRLIAHPWDGHTTANLLVELDECVMGVCSCAHSPRLPAPAVSAHTVSIQGDIFVNVSWVTPLPQFPQRLPPGLKKHRYAVSIGKQMVSDAHPSPWFANTITRYAEADGLVSDRDIPRWLLLPITERSGEQNGQRGGQRGDVNLRRHIVLDVRLLARVNLVDDRGCVGPAGNATAYDPVEAAKISVRTYILWAVFGGSCVIAMGALIAVGTRIVKRILNAFRPAPVSAPLESLSRRPAWFPLQLRTPIWAGQSLLNILPVFRVIIILYWVAQKYWHQRKHSSFFYMTFSVILLLKFV